MIEITRWALCGSDVCYVPQTGLFVVGCYALTTLPLRMQDVQTRIRLVAAPTRACTGRRFTFQRRLVTLWA